MNKEVGKKCSYSVRLHFDPIQLPPVTDILVLGKKYPQGIKGVRESFRFLAPDEFEIIELQDLVEFEISAILINKRILKRMPSNEIIDILKKYVFPYMENDEAVNVHFSVTLFYDGIQGEYLVNNQ